MQLADAPPGVPAGAPRPTSPLLLIVAWLVVGVPAAWGVSQTVMRSLDLFKSPAAAPAVAPAVAPTIAPAPATAASR